MTPEQRAALERLLHVWLEQRLYWRDGLRDEEGFQQADRDFHVVRRMLERNQPAIEYSHPQSSDCPDCGVHGLEFHRENCPRLPPTGLQVIR